MPPRRPTPSHDVASAPPPPRDHRHWWILAAAALIRVVALAQLSPHPLLQPSVTLDDGAYVALATRVAGGDLALAPEPYYLAPFYTYLLGAVFATSGGSLLAARVVQALLGVVAVWLVIDTATAWFNRRAGLIAGALAATTGLLVFNEALILQSSLDPFLAALALWAATRAFGAAAPGRETAGLRWFVVTGAALGMLSLNRPNAVVCAPAMALAWWVGQRSHGAWRQSAALLLGAVLMVAPATLRNRIVAGEWVLLTSHGGLNFYIGNASGADGTWKAVPGITPSIAGQVADVRRLASDALGRPATAREASDHFYGLAWRDIAAAPGAWLGLLARKVALTLSAHDAALNHSFAYFAWDEATILRVLIVGPWLLVPLGLVGFVVAAPPARRRSYAAWLALPVVYALTLVAFFVSSRYRLPLLVALAIGAGGGLAWVGDRIRAAAWRASARAILTCVALGALVQWPLGTDDGRMSERMERIVSWVREGRVGEAEALLAQTESLHPDPALLHYRVGIGLRERHDLAGAVAHLARAGQLAPGDADVALALGEALLASGRAGEAIRPLTLALHGATAPNEAAYHLAHAHAQLGQADAARAALARIPPEAAVDATQAGELGQAAFRLGDAVLAERHFVVATRLSPSSAEAWERLGVSLGAQGRRVEGIEALRRAVSLDGTRVASHVHLSLLYARTGHRDAAIREVEEALRLAPDAPDARRLMDELAAR